MHTVLHDLRFALRTYARRRGVAALTVGTIALGIGAATAIYSVVDGVLFRPLAYTEPGRLIAVWQTYPKWRGDPILNDWWDQIPLSIPEFHDWRASQTAFTDVAIWAGGSAMLSNQDTPERVALTRASASMLDVLGVTPALGRYFLGEDAVGGPPVTLLSHAAWQARFAGDPTVLGRTVRLDERPYTIIGVLPRGLTLSRESDDPPFWTPVGQDSSDATNRGNHSYSALARLKTGVTLEQATTEADHILRGSEPPTSRGVRLADWQADQTRTVRAPLLVLLGAAGLLLLIACVNVATLLLGEAAAREHEVAARMALGAGRLRVARQLLTEALLLAGLGAMAGTALAWGGTRILVAMAPSRIPGLAAVHTDLRVLAFAIVAAVATGALFGLAPAIVLARSSPAGALRGATGQSARGRGRVQGVSVAVEFALSVMLLIGAGLLVRSLDRLTRVDPGFRTDNLVSVRVALPVARYAYSDSGAIRWFYHGVTDRIAAIPNVLAVTASTTPPFGGGSSSNSFELEGQSTGPDERHHEAQQRTTLPNFFATMGIPVLAGRVYTDADRLDTPLVGVISETMARREWPGESALGKRVKFQGKWREVVGIVGDIKYRKLSMDDQATIYTPLDQRDNWGLGILVRTRSGAGTLAGPIRAAVREVDPGVAVTSIDPMNDLIKRSFAEERYRTMLISLFGVLAVLLAAVGLYGVTARAVNLRLRELGIRLALGARELSVIRLVVSRSLKGAALGGLIGIAGAVLVSRQLVPFLYGIGATDPVTYTTIVALLGVVSGAASWIPARRAARVAPAVVLRSE